MTNLDRYVRFRISNPSMGHTVASTLAGYSSGAPQEAVDAWRFASAARKEPDVVDWLTDELEGVEEQARALADRAASIRLKLRAVQALRQI